MTVRRAIRQREIVGELSRRIRGIILQFISEQEHSRPAGPRHSARSLMGLLRRLLFDVVLADVIEELRFLERRGYLEFTVIEDTELRRLPEIQAIALTDKGRDLIDGTATDPSVELD